MWPSLPCIGSGAVRLSVSFRPVSREGKVTETSRSVEVSYVTRETGRTIFLQNLSRSQSRIMLRQSEIVDRAYASLSVHPFSPKMRRIVTAVSFCLVMKYGTL